MQPRPAQDIDVAYATPLPPRLQQPSNLYESRIYLEVGMPDRNPCCTLLRAIGRRFYEFLQLRAELPRDLPATPHTDSSSEAGGPGILQSGKRPS
jgi:hypothetical protein